MRKVKKQNIFLAILFVLLFGVSSIPLDLSFLINKDFKEAEASNNDYVIGCAAQGWSSTDTTYGLTDSGNGHYHVDNYPAALGDYSYFKVVGYNNWKYDAHGYADLNSDCALKKFGWDKNSDDNINIGNWDSRYFRIDYYSESKSVWITPRLILIGDHQGGWSNTDTNYELRWDKDNSCYVIENVYMNANKIFRITYMNIWSNEMAFGQLSSTSITIDGVSKTLVNAGDTDNNIKVPSNAYYTIKYYPANASGKRMVVTQGTNNTSFYNTSCDYDDSTGLGHYREWNDVEGNVIQEGYTQVLSSDTTISYSGNRTNIYPVQKYCRVVGQYHIDDFNGNAPTRKSPYIDSTTLTAAESAGYRIGKGSEAIFSKSSHGLRVFIGFNSNAAYATAYLGLFASTVSSYSTCELNYLNDSTPTLDDTYDLHDLHRHTDSVARAGQMTWGSEIMIPLKITSGYNRIELNFGNLIRSESSTDYQVWLDSFFISPKNGYVNSDKYTVTAAVNDSSLGQVNVNGSLTGIPWGASLSTSNNVVTISDQAMSSVTLTATTKSVTGYDVSFSGWSNNTGTIIANRTITANFTSTAHNYDITVDLDGGSYGGSYPSDADYNEVFELPAPTAPSGYIFGGWKVTSGLNSSTAKYGSTNNPTTAISSSDTVCFDTPTTSVFFKNITPTDSASVTIKAIYTEASFTLAYSSENVSKGTVSGSIASGSSAIYDSSITVTATPATGYNFTGWYEGGIIISKKASYTFNMPARNYTLVAKFGADIYQITYKDQDNVYYSGSNIDDLPDTHTYGVTTELVDGEKTGYEFDGWFTNPACTGSAVSTIGATAYSADFTLYAKWSPNKYTITLNNDGATTAGTTTIYELYDNGYYTDSACSNEMDGSHNPIAIPTKTNYTFGGYYTEAGGGGTQYIDANGYLTNNAANNHFSAAGTLYAKWTFIAGYYFIGTECDWNIEDAILLTQVGDTSEYKATATLTGGNRGKIAQANSSKEITAWYHTSSVYCAMPQDYPVSVYGKDTVDAAAYYSNSGTYDIYFNTSTGGLVSFNPIVTLTLKVDDVTIGTLTRDDTGKGEGVVSQFKYEGYTAVKDGVIAIYLGESLLTVVNDGDSHNNVYSESGTLKFSNPCSSTIYLKFKNSSRELYQKGWTTNVNGVKTGTTFYIYDPDAKWNKDTPQMFVRFDGPTGDYYDKYWYVACGLYDSTNKLWSCTVPYIDGGSTSTTWTRAEAYRYQSGATTNGTTVTGTFWNSITDLSAFDGSQYNSIKVLNGGNDDGIYHLYADGGIASGRGFYLNWSNRERWGTHTTKFAIYFIGTLTDGSAIGWSDFMKQVPGEDDVYETIVPQYKSADVEWIYVIAVACPSDAVTPCFTMGENEYETQKFYYSKALSVNQYIVLDGTLDGELKAHANLTTGYTDATRAERFAQNFINTYTAGCVQAGTSKGVTRSAWESGEDDYKQMSSIAQDIFTDAIPVSSGETYLEQASARYDYIIHKYGIDTTYTTGYKDYASRGGSANYLYKGISNTNRVFDVFKDNGDTVIVIIASSISLISITTICILVVHKKKNTLR